MKTKNLISFLLPLAFLLLFQTCTRHPGTPVIGLMMDQFNVERWAQDTAAFINAVKEQKGKVICVVANGDPAKQLEQAKMLIRKKVDVLVIVPVDLNKAADIVAAANKASIPTISYDRLIRNSFVDYYVSFDNVKIGELQADYIRQQLGKGSVALIGGPASDQNSFFLRCGQIGALQPFIDRGDIKITCDKGVASWSFDEGYKTALGCLKDGKVDAIIAGNDLLARGAIRALKEKGLAGKVLVAGQDADSEACELIEKGLQTVSVYKPIGDIAGYSAKLAMDLATGIPVIESTVTINNGLKPVPSFLLTPTLVNKGNIALKMPQKK